MKYLAQFVGRTRGAIGIFYPCEVTVEAANQEAARLKLYDTHEHIQGLVLTEKPDNPRRFGEFFNQNDR